VIKGGGGAAGGFIRDLRSRNGHFESGFQSLRLAATAEIKTKVMAIHIVHEFGKRPGINRNKADLSRFVTQNHALRKTRKGGL
jgi:hypothetical protein